MIARFRFVLVSDLKAYLAEKGFTRIHLSYLIILSLLLIIIWPTALPKNLQVPQLLLVLAYAQTIILTYLAGKLALGISFDKKTSLDDWLRYTPLTFVEITLGKWGAVFLIVLFMFFTSSPLLLLAYFMEGATIESTLRVYFLIPIPIITFINLGLFLRFILGTPTISSFILNMLTILFFFSLFLTRTTKVELLYLNSWFLLSSLVLSFLPLFIALRKSKKIERGFSP